MLNIVLKVVQSAMPIRVRYFLGEGESTVVPSTGLIVFLVVDLLEAAWLESCPAPQKGLTARTMC